MGRWNLHVTGHSTTVDLQGAIDNFAKSLSAIGQVVDSVRLTTDYGVTTLSSAPAPAPAPAPTTQTTTTVAPAPTPTEPTPTTTTPTTTPTTEVTS